MRVTSPGDLGLVPVAPGRLPLLGHATQLARRPLPFLCSLRGLGPLVRVDVGTWPLYVATTPAAAHDVLVARARYFDKGRLFDRLRPMLGEGLITSNGSFHRDQRRRVQPAFSRARLDDYTDVMSRHARAMAEAWRPGETVALTEALQDLTFATLAEVMFSAHTAPGTRIACSMAQVNAGIPARALLPHALTRLPLPFNRRFDRAIALLHAAVDDTVRRHRTGAAPDPGLLSVLTQPDLHGTKMTERHIRDETITLMLAGSETTATVLSWAFHHLAQRPDLAQRVQRELDTVLRDRPLRAADLPALGCTRQVLSETLRLHPLTLVMRRSHSPTAVQGIVIPPGTEVAVSAYAIQRDPGLYADPLSFDPDRWTRQEITELPKGACAPFGEGNRKCIGEAFAWNHMSVVVAEVLRRWHLRPAPGHTVREVASIHPYPDSLPMTVTHRPCFRKAG
ncbi:cytochrome P450 [Streptomyces sp. NPDC087300]|uniref:cytochrome P450 n=1 Tax=Streptomyces sp. NPDC087300 TaxID=3365780 RepID=UPI00380097B1